MRHAIGGLCALLVATTAYAGVGYQFSTDQSSYDVSAGTATVKVYLRESLGGGNSILASHDGLGSAAFRVNLTAGSGVKIAAVNGNPLFDGPLGSSSVTDSLATLSESIDFLSPGVKFAAGETDRVLLGTVSLAATGAGPATFAIELYDASAGNVATALFPPIALDSAPGDGSFSPLAGGYTFTAVVPEPAGLALLALAAVGMGRRFRRGQMT